MEQELCFDIDHIAKLARLQLTLEQRVRFASEMESIAAMAEDLPEIRESKTACSAKAVPFRPDLPEACAIPQDDFFKNAPELCHHCFAVPQTVEVEQ